MATTSQQPRHRSSEIEKPANFSTTPLPSAQPLEPSLKIKLAQKLTLCAYKDSNLLPDTRFDDFNHRLLDYFLVNLSSFQKVTAFQPNRISKRRVR